MTAPGTTTSPADHAAAFDDRIGPFVADAAMRVPGFAARLKRAGLSAEDLSSTADLDRLPVLTKDEVLELQHADPPFGRLVAEDVTPRRVFQSPGPIYEVEPSVGDHWRWQPALEAAGFTTDDVVLNAYSYHLSPAGAMFEQAARQLGCTVLPGGVGNVDAQVRACVDLGVTAYVGVPSYLKKLLDSADRPLPLRRALVSGEPLPPSLREWLLERMDVVQQCYGTAETGNLGYECERMEGWHVPADALVQICDPGTGEAVHDDQEGQIVVTVLSPEVPLVRFGTGDLSRWVLEPCGCGRDLPRLAGWLGRVGDGVKVRGMFLQPRQVAGVMGRVDGVDRYGFTVDRVDHADQLRCAVVASGDGSAIRARVRELVRTELRFDVEVDLVDDLPEDVPTIVDRRRWE